jgi:hypothetical protein
MPAFSYPTGEEAAKSRGVQYPEACDQEVTMRAGALCPVTLGWPVGCIYSVPRPTSSYVIPPLLPACRRDAAEWTDYKGTCGYFAAPSLSGKLPTLDLGGICGNPVETLDLRGGKACGNPRPRLQTWAQC